MCSRALPVEGTFACSEVYLIVLLFSVLLHRSPCVAPISNLIKAAEAKPIHLSFTRCGSIQLHLKVNMHYIYLVPLCILNIAVCNTCIWYRKLFYTIIVSVRNIQANICKKVIRSEHHNVLPQRVVTKYRKGVCVCSTWENSQLPSTMLQKIHAPLPLKPCKKTCICNI